MTDENRDTLEVYTAGPYLSDFQLHVKSALAEIDRLKAENDRFAIDTERLAQKVAAFNGIVDELQNEIAKLRNELSDANVIIEAYRSNAEANKKPHMSAVVHATKVLNRRNHLGSSCWYYTSNGVYTVPLLNSLSHEDAITIADKYEASADVLAITELHNRVAALEATLKNAKVMTHIPSGKLYIEVES